jgi:flagellar motor component MotA
MDKKFKLKQTKIDPETGSVSSDVEYVPNFIGSMKQFNSLLSSIKDIFTKTKDQDINRIFSSLQELRNKYRTHIRNKYPEEYKVTNEISVTGTEGYNSKNTFKNKTELKEYLKEEILLTINENKNNINIKTLSVELFKLLNEEGIDLSSLTKYGTNEPSTYFLIIVD